MSRRASRIFLAVLLACPIIWMGWYSSQTWALRRWVARGFRVPPRCVQPSWLPPGVTGKLLVDTPDGSRVATVFLASGGPGAPRIAGIGFAETFALHQADECTEQLGPEQCATSLLEQLLGVRQTEIASIKTTPMALKGRKALVVHVSLSGRHRWLFGNYQVSFVDGRPLGVFR
jgi:hypothetical protein